MQKRSNHDDDDEHRTLYIWFFYYFEVGFLVLLFKMGDDLDPTILGPSCLRFMSTNFDSQVL